VTDRTVPEKKVTLETPKKPEFKKPEPPPIKGIYN